MTKLTKELLDKMRHIEGFPIGEDEDIIALSDPPHYTACPNPFIEDFIQEHGKPYDEETDDYNREPFAADVSEGKNDPIYNAHSYHTKVPYKAIMRYILHYTEPGDIVFDGFCGTGMTGVAAQMCGDPDPQFKMQIEQEMPYVKWGARKAILNDLSPAATFIAANYNLPVDVDEFEKEAKRIIAECEKECGWMYETQHVDEDGQVITGLDGNPIMGRINYVVWSDVFLCPSCSGEFVFWDVAIDHNKGCFLKQFSCPHCSIELRKSDCDRVTETVYDNGLKKNITLPKQVPKLINYSAGKQRFEKSPDAFDLNLLKRVQEIDIPYWFPTAKLPEGDKTRDPARLGFSRAHHFYTKRNLWVLSAIHSKASSNIVKLLFTSLLIRTSKLYKFTLDRKMGTVSGTYYIPSIWVENVVFKLLNRKFRDFMKARFMTNHGGIVQCGGLGEIITCPTNSVDYIFTDPPFGSNLMYSELNFLWEAWLKAFTNNKSEAVVSKFQKKRLQEYQFLMEECFEECHRILKPGRWMTVEFHNSANSVWNSIQEALMQVGFIVADVRVLNKQQGSFNQVNAHGAVKQDLIISAYKPKESFRRRFIEKAGSLEAVWDFVRQHLENLPVVVESQGNIGVITERQAFLLFDRMVAYHVVNGISVPLDAGDFYKGLKTRFLERDGMYFLSNQASEYDAKQLGSEFGNIQIQFFVTDEKSAIQWLYNELQVPQTYQEVQPKFIRQYHQLKHERMPELIDILEENFLKDEQGKWYVPDPNKQSDLEKLREKALLREFEEYKDGKGVLKVFRTEAVRAGFKSCWQNRDFAVIIKVADRIPEKVLQEDQTLLMFYNNALTRVEK